MSHYFCFLYQVINHKQNMQLIRCLWVDKYLNPIYQHYYLHVYFCSWKYLLTKQRHSKQTLETTYFNSIVAKKETQRWRYESNVGDESNSWWVCNNGNTSTKHYYYDVRGHICEARCRYEDCHCILDRCINNNHIDMYLQKATCN